MAAEAASGGATAKKTSPSSAAPTLWSRVEEYFVAHPILKAIAISVGVVIFVILFCFFMIVLAWAIYWVLFVLFWVFGPVFIILKGTFLALLSPGSKISPFYSPPAPATGFPLDANWTYSSGAQGSYQYHTLPLNKVIATLDIKAG